jgi:alpha-D-ribose 1-methylphosphonate 5-phosphate C-P lyase
MYWQQNSKFGLIVPPCIYLARAGKRKSMPCRHTRIESLCFEDHPFRTEDMSGSVCRLCRASGVFMDEFFDSATGEKMYQCSDSGYYEKRRKH